jgi:hypothetical protein
MISREEQEQQKERVILSWSSTMKKTVYDSSELDTLKKSSGGRGWLYYNPVTDSYERPTSIDLVPKRKQRQLGTT